MELPPPAMPFKAPSKERFAMDSDARRIQTVLAPNSSEKFNRILQMLIDEHEREIAEHRIDFNKQTPMQIRPELLTAHKDALDDSTFKSNGSPNVLRSNGSPPKGSSPTAPNEVERPNGLSTTDGELPIPNSVPPSLDMDHHRVIEEDSDSNSSDEVAERSSAARSDHSPDTKQKVGEVKSVTDTMLSTYATNGKGEKGHTMSAGERIVASQPFAFASAVIILTNTFYIGFQADVMVTKSFDRLYSDPDNSMDSFFSVFDTIYFLVFAVELFARLFLLKPALFLRGKDRYWHLLDSVIVLASALEMFGAAAGDSVSSVMSVLRTVRLVRILRLLRVASSIDCIKCCVRSMQTMLHAVGGVVSSFVPALLVLGMCIYICDIFILEAIRGYLNGLDVVIFQTSLEIRPVVASLRLHYGDVGEGFSTLLAAVTGGYSWTDVSSPLGVISPWYRAFFQLYIIFVMIGLLNIIAGLFVNVAMTATSLDQDMAIDELIKSEARFVQKLVDLLNDADKDCSGTMSWEEMCFNLEDERVKAYFNTLDLDVKCLARVFDILEHNEDGEVTIESFAKGCIENRGSAKSIDIVMIVKTLDTLMKKVDHLQSTGLQLSKTGPCGPGPSPVIRSLSKSKTGEPSRPSWGGHGRMAVHNVNTSSGESSLWGAGGEVLR